MLQKSNLFMQLRMLAIMLTLALHFMLTLASSDVFPIYVNINIFIIMGLF